MTLEWSSQHDPRRGTRFVATLAGVGVLTLLKDTSQQHQITADVYLSIRHSTRGQALDVCLEDDICVARRNEENLHPHFYHTDESLKALAVELAGTFLRTRLDIAKAALEALGWTAEKTK